MFVPVYIYIYIHTHTYLWPCSSSPKAGEKDGFEETPPKPSRGKVAKQRSKAAATKLKEQKQKSDEKAKQATEELKKSKGAIQVLEDELLKNKDRFRKFRNRNPGHKLTNYFKELDKLGEVGLKDSRVKELLSKFNLEIPARFGVDETFDEVKETSSKIKTTTEEEKNFGTLCTHYNLKPSDPDIDKTLDAFWLMGNHRRVPLSKALQKLATDGKLPEASKFKYYVVGDQQRKQAP